MMSISLGTVSVGLRMDKSQFERDLTAAKGKMADLDLGVKRMAASFATQIGAAMMGVGAGITASLASAVKAAGNFESNLNVFQATSHASGEAMKEVSALAIKLGNDMSLPATSAKTAVDAMMSLSRTGLQLKDVMASARGSLMLAAAGHLEAGKAAQFVGQTLNQFALSGKEANRVADIMAALLPAAGSKVEQTANAFRYGATAAHQAKISIQDFATEIGLMSRAGLQGSRAGTALAQMFTQLEAPSKAGAATLKELGVHIYDASGVMKSQRTIIQELGGALSKLTDQQRDADMKYLFAANARRAANVVLLGGVQAFDEMAKKVNKTGEAAAQSEARMKGFEGAVEGLKNQIETLQITVGRALLPIVTKAVQGISSLIEQFGRLSPGIQDGIIKFVAVAGAVLLVGGGLLFLGGQIASGVLAFGELAAACGLAGTSVGAALGVIGSVAAEIALPIAAIALAWATNFGHIREVVTDFVSWIQPYLQRLMSDLGQLFGESWSQIASLTREAWSRLSEIVGPVLQQIFDNVKSITR